MVASTMVGIDLFQWVGICRTEAMVASTMVGIDLFQWVGIKFWFLACFTNFLVIVRGAGLIEPRIL